VSWTSLCSYQTVQNSYQTVQTGFIQQVLLDSHHPNGFSVQTEETPQMLHKLSLMAAVAACLTLPTAVFAAPHGGHFGGGHFVGGHGHFVGGPHFVGGGRHFWHGRWYNYGIGPCWAPSPAGYVWICG
jgi:hypothetical protein